MNSVTITSKENSRQREETKGRPYITSMLQCKCNHCRQGDLFITKSAYTKGFMKMHETCPVCGHPTEIESGFYYGTGYLSYAITIAFSVATFIAWYVLIGMSVNDNRVFWWLGVNTFLLIALQPWLMRFSRAMWYSFFVKYNKDWMHEEKAKNFERVNKVFKNAW